MTDTETATIAAADHIIKAPAEHLAKEPIDCLLEIIDVCKAHLLQIRLVGIGFRLVQLDILKAKYENQAHLL